MSLDEVRAKINEIDAKMKLLYEERLSCSKEVAKVKLATGDEVYKPVREAEIYSKFGSSTIDVSCMSFVRKIVQLSRKFQYQCFVNENKIDENFFAWIGNKEVLEKGGVLKLCLKVDDTGINGLNLRDILLICADTKLKIVSTSYEKDFNITYEVGSTEEELSEAIVLSYMLYKETLH